MEKIELWGNRLPGCEEDGVRALTSAMLDDLYAYCAGQTPEFRWHLFGGVDNLERGRPLARGDRIHAMARDQFLFEVTERKQYDPLLAGIEIDVIPQFNEGETIPTGFNFVGRRVDEVDTTATTSAAVA